MYRVLEWETIPGYPDYEISNRGSILSFKRIPGCYLKTEPDKTGYVHVGLSNSKKSRIFGVHRLVAMTFIGDIPKFYVVNHKNGIKHDNRVENLEIITNGENVSHAHKTGLVPPRLPTAYLRITKGVQFYTDTHYYVEEAANIWGVGFTEALNRIVREWIDTQELYEPTKQEARHVSRLD